MASHADFLTAVQHRVARVSVSPSAVRGQGKGVAKSARPYLAELELSEFVVSKRAVFDAMLDTKTAELIRALPSPEFAFGVSRKLLNIFLRDCLYNHYLRQEYSLQTAEEFLEIPLDSITAGYIYKLSPASARPPTWKTVKHLTREVSEVYQRAVHELAEDCGRPRVHLDTYWWGTRT